MTPNHLSASDAASAPDRHQASARRAWRWLLPVFLTPALVWGCWRSAFLPYDDMDVIAKNPVVSPAASWWLAWQPDSAQSFYYPLTLWSFRIDHVLAQALPDSLMGMHPWATMTRTGNLLLHAGAALLLWLVLRSLRAGPALAGFVVAAFALHPAVCESVAWPVERKTVLAGCLGLGAVALYMRACGPAGRLGALALFAGALLAKASAFGVLAIVFALEILSRPRCSRAQEPGAAASTVADALGRNWRAGAQRLLPWVVIAGIRAYVGRHVGSHLVIDPPGGTLATALLTDGVILWRYAATLFYPPGVSAYYGIAPVVSLSDARFWSHAPAFAALVAITVAASAPGERRVTVFGWLWFVGALGPNLNLVGINELMHDRFVYTASAGFWLACGLALRGFFTRAPELRAALAPYAPVAVALLAVSCASMSLKRSGQWGDLGLLMLDAIQKEPASASAHIFFAHALATEAASLHAAGDPEAETLLAQAAREMEVGTNCAACPDFARYYKPAEAHTNLAILYVQQNRMEEALARVDAAVAASRGRRVDGETIANAYWVRARVAMSRAQPQAALAVLGRALHYAPHRTALIMDRARALAMLADSLQRSGKVEASRQCRAEALATLQAIRPTDPLHAQAQALAAEMQRECPR